MKLLKTLNSTSENKTLILCSQFVNYIQLTFRRNFNGKFLLTEKQDLLDYSDKRFYFKSIVNL